MTSQKLFGMGTKKPPGGTIQWDKGADGHVAPTQGLCIEASDASSVSPKFLSHVPL